MPNFKRLNPAGTHLVYEHALIDSLDRIIVSPLMAWTPVTSQSGNVANAAAVATLPGVAGKTTHITGFEVTGAGATAGLAVSVTVTGGISGTMTFTVVAAVGAAVANEPLIVEFPSPIPASAVNTAIVVTVPALGAGNTNSTVVAHGYQV